MKYIIIRTALVIFTAILAMVIPKFALFINLVGAFAGTTLAFILPCYLYIVVFKDEISNISRTFHKVIIVLGIGLGIMSFLTSLYELI